MQSIQLFKNVSKLSKPVILAVICLAAIGNSVQAADTLNITFTTSRPPGNDLKYEPKNLHAVWIEDSAGNFVKTIARWADKGKNELALWTAIDGTYIDGRTGATQLNYKTYSIS